MTMAPPMHTHTYICIYMCIGGASATIVVVVVVVVAFVVRG